MNEVVEDPCRAGTTDGATAVEVVNESGAVTTYRPIFVVVVVPSMPEELFRVLDDMNAGPVTIMRAARLDEPVYVGLG